MNMMSRRRMPAVVLALLLAVGSCGSTRTETGAGTHGYMGSINDLDLSAYKGQVVVLNFWATWCTPCRIEIPDLVQMRKDFPEQDVAIIGVSVDARGTPDELASQLQRFVSRYEINYPTYLDSEQEFAAGYDPEADYMRFVPTTVLIDQNGAIHDTHLGVPRNARGQVDPYGVLASQVQTLLDGG